MKLRVLLAALTVSLILSGFPLYSNTVNAETNQDKLEENRAKQSEIEKEKQEKQEERSEEHTSELQSHS